MPRLRSAAVALAVATVLAALAGGCGSGSGDSAGEAPAVGTTTAEVTTEAVTTDAVTADPAPETPAPTPSVTTVTVAVVGGAPEGGIVRASLTKGDRVALVVRSDVADEIHLHGYDLMKDVAAGGTARITFVASLTGRFEAELEQRGVKIAELTVNP